MLRLTLRALVAIGTTAVAWAQPELAQWGNLRGIRVDGHLHAFATRLELPAPDGSVAAVTGHYAHPSSYRREGDHQHVTVELPGVRAVLTVTAVATGAARFALTATTTAANAPARLWFTVAFRQPDLHSAAGPQPHGIELSGSALHWSLQSDSPLDLTLDRSEGRTRLRLAVPVHPTEPTPPLVWLVRAAGPVEGATATVSLDRTRPGRAFAGVGGNFRLQFPDADPAIIDYHLAHLRVASGRIALWWRDWDADEAASPLAAARAGVITPRQRDQIALARRLAARGIPIIVSTWDPPAWGILTGPRAPGTYTDPVAPAKWRRLAESIADYLQFLKESAGVEAALFSFNEPDLGLMRSPTDHAAFIKVLGAILRDRGLATKHLVADTSNATLNSLRHVQAVIDDPATRPFVGAVAFHSWGGTDDANLVAWDAAARELGLPLLLSEGGPDAEAHRHPDLFLEPAYAFDEMLLYTRVCALAQPAGLLPWQLTADYSLLHGGGAYGHPGPLRPTPRFHALQQLADTPAGAFAVPATSDHPAVVAAAFTAPATGEIAVHLMNTGAARLTRLRGLPEDLTTLQVVATRADAGRAPAQAVPVTAGEAEIPLAPAGLTSVYGSSTARPLSAAR